MKKLFQLMTIIILSFAIFAGCGKGKGKEGAAPVSKEAAPAAKIEEVFKHGVVAIPDWANAVFSVNLKDALNDPEVKEQLKKDPKFKKFEEELKAVGIDINNDVSRISGGIADVNLANMQTAKPEFVIFLDVNYDETKLVELLKNKAKEQNYELIEEKVGKYTAFSSKKHPNEFKMALLKGKSILFASPSKFQSALDVVEGRGKSISANADLNTIVESVSGNLIWAVASISEANKTFLKQMSASPQFSQPPLVAVKDIADKIDFIKLGAAKDGDNIKLIVGGKCTDDGSSVKLKTFFDGLKGMAGMMLPPEIAQKISVGQDGKAADISMSLSKEDVEKLKETMGGVK